MRSQHFNHLASQIPLYLEPSKNTSGRFQVARRRHGALQWWILGCLAMVVGAWLTVWALHRVFTKQIKQILHQFALCTLLVGPSKVPKTHKLLTINFLRSLALSTEARMSRSQEQSEHSKWDRKVDTKSLIEMLDLPAKLPLNKLSCNYATWTCGHTPCHDANHLTFGLHQTGSWKQPGPRLARDKNVQTLSLCAVVWL